ncbi:hypothetical protein BS47DRAFT_1344530 [Hydnum rufescens UP504]|uniref:Uncharacterized protein n=1 Tax=Hydnum rufescens UP504 TaxID=1448309 RepID=A0A9P6AW78_9AGAM|nr:hypothetical protein BS47DRAFT_1344530 [Hydnum rufescens UP504]
MDCWPTLEWDKQCSASRHPAQTSIAISSRAMRRRIDVSGTSLHQTMHQNPEDVS